MKPQSDRMISLLFQGILFNMTALQVPTNNAEEAEVDWF